MKDEYEMNMDHLKERELTYFGHLKGAWKNAIRCGLAADVLFLHGLCPWFFDKYFSNYIKKAYKEVADTYPGKNSWGSTTINME